MAHLHRSIAQLRVTGADLDPAEITALLGCEPSAAQRKGDASPTASQRTRVAKFGMWTLWAADREPENFDAQISELLNRVSASVDVWKSIAEKYEIDLFCGLFMKRTNEEAMISAESLAALSQRGIILSLDIYAPDSEESNVSASA